MPLLQRQDEAFAFALEMADALCRSKTGSCGGDIRNLGLDGCLAQVAVVVAGALAHGGVDDHLDLSVGDEIEDVGTALIIFVYALTGDACLGNSLASLVSRENPEARLVDSTRDLRRVRAVRLTDGDEDGSLQGKDHLGCFLCLVEGAAGGTGNSQYFAGGTHLGSEDGVDFREHVEGEDGFLDTVVRNILFLEIRYRGLASGQFRRDDLSGKRHHADAADLGDKRDGSGGTRIGLEYVDNITLERVLFRCFLVSRIMIL